MVLCLSHPTAATDLSSPPTPPPKTPSPPPLPPTSPTRLVLAAMGNSDSGVWLARGLPPATSGRPGRSQPWPRPRALPPDIQGAWARGVLPQQGRCATRIPAGGSSRTKCGSTSYILFPAACSGYSHCPGEELRFGEPGTLARVTQRNWVLCGGAGAQLASPGQQAR